MSALIDPQAAAVAASRPLSGGDVLLRDYPGPAMRLDRRGRIVARNLDADVWASHLAIVGGFALRALAARVATTGQPEAARVQLTAAGVERVYDVACMPDGIDGDTILLGRDGTADMRLTNALIQSRQMFKDLVACSSDFAWETDPDGTFNFVSRPAALGYQTSDLDSRPAADLLHAEHPAPSPLPFRCQAPVEDVELWLRRADGSAACFLVSATPVRDRDGNLLGRRGVCRDVTELRQQEAALALARERQALSEAIVDSIRNEVDPRAMLAAAVRSTTAALGGGDGWLITLTDDGGAALAATTGGAELGAATIARLARRFRGLAGETVLAFAGGGRRLLAVGCADHGVIHGILCIARPAGAAKWQAHERALLASVAPAAAVAIAQAAQLAELQRLSSTDELTGLPNRRAFTERVEPRLAHLARSQGSAALLFCDLDNFKTINDRHGHAAGDDALRQVAGLLRAECRVGDVPARIGGDEFVVWLEDIDAHDAEAIAERLQQRFQGLAALSPDPARPFGTSIGVVVVNGTRPVPLSRLLSAADEAMYCVKRRGKRGIVVASADDVAGTT
jgi:diguanylate cyclase (GGDEF)-like protein/PAS domain S-box-containing protein